MADKVSNLDVLSTQASVELGGDTNELDESFPWDPNQPRHCRLWDRLGGRVTEATPLRLLWKKKLTESDVRRHYNRFVIHKDVIENSIARCLTFEQREDVCNKIAIEVAGHDEEGRRWELELKMRIQSTNNSKVYILQKQWSDVVEANGWRKGEIISIWGFPYGGIRDRWNFGPAQGHNIVYFVFTSKP